MVTSSLEITKAEHKWASRVLGQRLQYTHSQWQASTEYAHKKCTDEKRNETSFSEVGRAPRSEVEKNGHEKRNGIPFFRTGSVTEVGGEK